MSNKVPCGGFYLDDMLGVDENGKLGVNGGEPFKQLVTDDTGKVIWEDRLAYETEPVMTEILQETSVQFTGPIGNAVYNSFVDTPVPVIEHGAKCIVTFDGLEYNVVCTVLNGESVIGNCSIIGVGEDSGEPFFIVFNNNGTGMVIYTKTTSASHTISISAECRTIHKLDSKFAPDLLVNFYFDNSAGKLKSDKTFDEILKAYVHGTEVTAKYEWDGDMYLYMRLSWVRNAYDSPDNEISFSCIWGDISEGNLFVTATIIDIFPDNRCGFKELQLTGTLV